MKPILNIVCALVATLFLFSCKNVVTKKKVVQSPEEFALLLTKYEFTLDQEGLKKLLCHNCSVDPYKGISTYHRLLAERYRKNDVEFDDDKAHDFSGIKCKVVSKAKSTIELICNGHYQIKNKQGKLTNDSLIAKKITLVSDDNGLSYCPPVCNTSKLQSKQ